MTTNSLLRKTSSVLLIAGALLLGGYCVLEAQARFYLAHEKQYFESQLHQTSLVTKPDTSRLYAAAAAPARTGSVIGKLEIPRIGIHTLVLEGDDASILRRAAGHVPGTAMPGDPGGNVAVAAHRNTLFRPLRFIRRNDLIRIETLSGTVSYRVEFTKIVKPTDTAVLDNTGKSQLTLVTCYPFYFVGSAP
ncbi:MAG: class D sortase, partial [Candidatus Acidiferrum sp.]